jgi:hypothetical protein
VPEGVTKHVVVDKEKSGLGSANRHHITHRGKECGKVRSLAKEMPQGIAKKKSD